MMAAQPDGALCHVKDCGQPATVACEGCGRPYCPNHVRTLTIERREQPTQQRLLLGASPRLPTHTESYTLCARCSARPFQRALTQPPL
jgi:hypothetical protein